MRGVLVCLAVLAVVSGAVWARPQENELDNDIIPREPQSPLNPAGSSSSERPVSSSTASSSSTTSADKATTSSKPTDFLSRLVEDIIQIPIAALRAVNQLLNNISQRNAASSTTSTSTTPAAVTSKSF